MSDKCILDPTRDCIGSKHADVLQEQIQRELEEHKKRSHETHQQIFDRLNRLETGAAKLEEKYSSIIDKLTDLSGKITDLIARISSMEQKPAKRWDGIVDKILTALVAALIGALLIKEGIDSNG